jgi:PEP-CTERM motif
LKTLDEQLSHFRSLKVALQTRFPDFKAGGEKIVRWMVPPVALAWLDFPNGISLRWLYQDRFWQPDRSPAAASLYNSLQINLGTFDGALPTVAAVPEPGTWLMMILGFCGIGLLADGGARRVVARA